MSIGRLQPPAFCRSAMQVIALGVDVGADVVGDLAGVVAEADASVEACGAEPERRGRSDLSRRLPKADVVALVGAVADGFSKARSCFRPSKSKRADRRVGIGTVENHAFADLERRSSA